MAYEFHFELSEPITAEEVSAWHQRDGITAADTVPFELQADGMFIHFSGDAASASNLASYLPRIQAWLAERGVTMIYYRGDYLPAGFWRKGYNWE